MKKILFLVLLALQLTAWSTVDGAVILTNSTPKQYTGLSTDTKPTLVKGDAGSHFYETNTGILFIWNGSAWVLKNIATTSDTTRMTAPGNGTALATTGYEQFIIYYTVSAINTSVTTAMQVRAGAGGWTSVAIDSTIITTNGNKGFTYSGVASADSVRFKFISEAGGTNAVIIYNIKMSNPN